MNVFDVFNGDADGIFSLIQLRKVFPVEGTQHLITGVKRDISLLKKIDSVEHSDQVNVLDISFDKNVDDVERLLQAGAQLFYCDHHRANHLKAHKSLTAIVDTSAFVCTGFLVSQHLNYKHHLWAIAALFGDGLDKVAQSEAEKMDLSSEQIEQIRELGVLVNYNGYGASVDDLLFHPADLYLSLANYHSPLDVVDDLNSPYHELKKQYAQDFAYAKNCLPFEESEAVIALKLPNQAWSKRISGTYGNILAKENPARAIVIATDNDDETLTISLRAPKNNARGASDICSRYPSGGGRESAAGVNALSEQDLNAFVRQVADFYSQA